MFLFAFIKSYNTIYSKSGTTFSPIFVSVSPSDTKFRNQRIIITCLPPDCSEQSPTTPSVLCISLITSSISPEPSSQFQSPLITPVPGLLFFILCIVHPKVLAFSGKCCVFCLKYYAGIHKKNGLERGNIEGKKIN